MGNKLYVGNLPYSVRDADLGQAFAAFGSVVSAKVMMERDSGRSKGFGFVEMGSDAEAQAAIEGMHDKPLQGRNLVVNEARPMEPRPPRASFGGGRRDDRGGYGSFGGSNDGRFRSPYGPGPRGNDDFSGRRNVITLEKSKKNINYDILGLLKHLKKDFNAVIISNYK